ncbi:MAG TPA: hypothetical protein VFQ61_39185 [Polyangiaceae bacterium]|nr:hypothetical protein [Polyangiaceae bacterium]
MTLLVPALWLPTAQAQKREQAPTNITAQTALDAAKTPPEPSELPRSSDDSTRAAALDEEGTALLNQRRLSEACPRLAESFRLHPGTGVLLRLALCHELSRNAATAQSLYSRAAARARTAGDVEVAQLADKRAAELQPRISHLIVRFAPSTARVPNVTLLYDGSPLPTAELNSPLAVDPGPHVIEARAPGHPPFRQEVRVNEAATNYWITVVMAPNRVASLKPPPVSPAPRPAWPTQKTWALALGGIGIGAVTAGTIFGLTVASRMDRARKGCTDGHRGCSDEALELQDSARTPALASTLAFSAGAVSIAGALALWFMAPPDARETRDASLRAVPLLGPGSAGVQAVGRW